jgi:predicted ArsR family transcriptional regulator|tara:strand:+ start:273 stop:584 length:312 start_codon:yes stop_codon:yes gene_type:complete
MSYYNTTREKGKQLKVNWNKSESQDIKVMEYFNKHKEASPSQVWMSFVKDGGRVPMTSIRRSITNLTQDNYLIKSEKKKQGYYGRPEYIWSLNETNTRPGWEV